MRWFVKWKANRVSENEEIRAGVSKEDLMQEGFLAMLGVVQFWDFTKPYTFMTCLSYFLSRRFAKATGWDTNRKVINPTMSAASLDAPAGEDDDATLGDFIVDENAEDPADTAESRLLRKAIMEAVETLPPEQQEAIIGHFYHGLPLDMVDKKQYSKALQALRKPEISIKLRGFL